jgi:hypothetical protein
MVEVPVKLEQTWSPIAPPLPTAAVARVVSSPPELGERRVVNLREFLEQEEAEDARFQEAHPGTRVGQV